MDAVGENFPICIETTNLSLIFNKFLNAMTLMDRHCIFQQLDWMYILHRNDACRLCCGFKVFIGHENCISSFQSECHWWRCSKIYHFVGLQWVLSTFTNQISSLLYIKNMDAKPHFAQNIEIAKYFKRTKSIGVGWNKCSRKTRKKTQLTELAGIWKRRHNWQGNIKLIGNL